MIELGVDGVWREDHAFAREWAGRALAAARPLGDGPLVVSAAGVLAMAATLLGAIEEAEAALAEATATADALSLDDLGRCLDHGLNLIAGSALNLGHCRQAEAYAERALEVALATGQGNLFGTRFWVGLIRGYRGRLREAAVQLDAAVESARLTGPTEGLATMLTVRAMTASAAGDRAGALACAEEAVALLRDQEHTWAWMLANWAHAEALLEEDRAERATALLLDVYGGEETPNAPLRGRPDVYDLLTRCLLACDRVDDAERMATRARECAQRLVLPAFGATADRAQGAVAFARGDHATAVELALRAAETSEAAGEVMRAIDARALAGRALAAAGDAERAATELTHAAAAYGLAGATRRRDELEREVRRLGNRRVHRRTRPGSGDAGGLESLTERELQVARLIVDRRTNGEIAEALFLSKKTVESHIRNVFHKLGVDSRVEVARLVERTEEGRSGATPLS
jgi:DNA-binding NarL/FixJ family response regulator